MEFTGRRKILDGGRSVNTLPRVVPGFFLCLAAALVSADSPLTSTDLASAYSDLPSVKEAGRSHRVEGEVLAFLLSQRPNGEKAAVINAIGWEAQGGARAFVEGLAARRAIDVGDLKLAQFTASDRFVLGYLRALESYLDPAPLQAGALDFWGMSPMALLDQATLSLPNDFTVHYVRGLVEAQRAMADSPCSAYLATSRVLERFPVARRNLRAKALNAAQGYMELYKSGCGTPAPTTQKGGASVRLDPEHDQIYALALLGETIVAATQAGVVVWGTDQKRPTASRDEKICTNVIVRNDAAWAGCYGRVVRWDGKGWKSYLQDPGAQDAYGLMPDAEGGLQAYRGTNVWSLSADANQFVPVSPGFAEDTHHALIRRNGDLWRIVFMRAVIGPRGTYAVRSTGYPGSDPRALVEDSEGGLWVADFKNGLFRLDEQTEEFNSEPALGDAGVTVAVDGSRGRTFFLHYTNGVMIQQNDQTQIVELPDLEFTRDLLFDDGSGDVWVAGWTGLARLRETKGRWLPEYWRLGAKPAPRPKGPPPPPPPPKAKRTPY